MSREAYKALAFLFQYLVFRVLDQRKGEISNQASCRLISQSGYKTSNHASLILKVHSSTKKVLFTLLDN